MNKHSSHADIIKRLKRASGHLDKVVEMIEKEKECLDVAQQLQAVTSALSKAKQIYVQDHIEHCIETASGKKPEEFSKQVRDLKQITKYL
ncbi:MAG: metal-sensing transcriptional repressor [Nitrospinaceae bacterium]|jgi:uncharacterized protein|nr:metal-sensing transcriptional repressor [Nitrospinaceae bacterium]